MWLLSVFLKPFIATVVLTLVLLLARLIYRWMPDSRLKLWLFAPLPGHKPRDWSAFPGRSER
jgi:hypothetical protein